MEVGAGGHPKTGSPTEKKPLCVNESTGGGTVYLSGLNGCWQQFHSKCTPVALYIPQWTVMNLQGHKHDASCNSRPCCM